MGKACFRFYEELNEFLPPGRRKVCFAHEFREPASVKDMIESLGVPHTEVDMILANGESVDFAYLVREGDRISVYPVFETFDIRQVSRVRPDALREIRFILDIHLGRLARYLRMMGFDAAFNRSFTAEQIISLSLEEKRIILSRSRSLLKRRRITHGFCLLSPEPEEQARMVLQRFDLSASLAPFTRCLECNARMEDISAEQVADLVPPDVLAKQRRFRSCPSCRRVYWEGSHFAKMEERILRISQAL